MGEGREEATRAKRTEEKVSEKSVLGRDIKSSSTGVTRRDPLLSAKALSLFLSSFSPFPNAPPLPPSLPLVSLIQVCLAKIHRLSLKVTRRNRRRVTRACKRVEGTAGEGRGWQMKGGGGRRARGRGKSGGGWLGGGNHEADGARLHALSFLAISPDTAENPPKGSTRNKGHPSLRPTPSPSALFAPVISLPHVPLRVHSRV